MADLSRRTCPHGNAPSTCLICQALDVSELSDSRRPRATPARSAGRSLGWTVATFGIVALVVLFVVSWAAALLWTVVRIVELVAVAVIAGWVCWRLGVRHGRRHPG